MIIFFILDVFPLHNAMFDFGILSALDRNDRSSLFALPFSGGDFIFIIKIPSLMVTISFLLEEGVIFTLKLNPAISLYTKTSFTFYNR